MTVSRSDALVLFGVTGDLAHKMIFPALYALAKRGALNIPIIGVAFPKWSLARLHARVADSIKRSDGIDDKHALHHLLSQLSYVSGDYNDPGTFTAIKKALGKARRPAHYLAIPPSLFETVIKGLGAAKLAEHARAISKSRSDAIWPPRGSSTTWRGQCSQKTRSSASTTSSERRRS
jgi:glucose-6-phosphate 1-dehydrogenase